MLHEKRERLYSDVGVLSQEMRGRSNACSISYMYVSMLTPGLRAISTI